MQNCKLWIGLYRTLELFDNHNLLLRGITGTPRQKREIPVLLSLIFECLLISFLFLYKTVSCSISWTIIKAHTHTHTCIHTCTDKNAHSQLWRDISMTLWRTLDTVQRRGTRSSHCLFSDRLCIGRLVSSRWQPWIAKHLECHFFWFKKNSFIFCQDTCLSKALCFGFGDRYTER